MDPEDRLYFLAFSDYFSGRMTYLITNGIVFLGDQSRYTGRNHLAFLHRIY